MARFVVATRRDAKRAGAASALRAVEGVPGVTVLASVNPDVVTIEAAPDVAATLQQNLAATHLVEAEVRRSSD